MGLQGDEMKECYGDDVEWRDSQLRMKLFFVPPYGFQQALISHEHKSFFLASHHL
jgi:hypothetical protein